MSLPKKDFRGQTATITMMELRSNPGEAFDLVSHGMHIHVTRAGKHIATIVPPNEEDEHTTVHPNGTITGRIPLTFRKNLGG